MMGQCITKAWNGLCTLCASTKKNKDDSLLFPFLSPSTISNLRLQSQAHPQQPLIPEVQCGSPVKITDASSVFSSALSQAFLQMQVCPHCRKDVLDDPSIECMQQDMLQSFNNLLLMRHNESNPESVMTLMQTKVATVRRSCHQRRGMLASPNNTSCEEEDNSLSPRSSEVEFLWTSASDNGLFPDNSITVFHSQEDLFGQEEEEEEASAPSDDYAKSYVTYLESLTYSYNNDKLPLCLTVSSSNNFA